MQSTKIIKLSFTSENKEFTLYNEKIKGKREISSFINWCSSKGKEIDNCNERGLFVSILTTSPKI